MLTFPSHITFPDPKSNHSTLLLTLSTHDFTFLFLQLAILLTRCKPHGGPLHLELEVKDGELQSATYAEHSINFFYPFKTRAKPTL